jgi:hypothetical protein
VEISSTTPLSKKDHQLIITSSWKMLRKQHGDNTYFQRLSGRIAVKLLFLFLNIGSRNCVLPSGVIFNRQKSNLQSSHPYLLLTALDPDSLWWYWGENYHQVEIPIKITCIALMLQILWASEQHSFSGIRIKICIAMCYTKYALMICRGKDTI